MPRKPKVKVELADTVLAETAVGAVGAVGDAELAPVSDEVLAAALEAPTPTLASALPAGVRLAEEVLVNGLRRMKFTHDDGTTSLSDPLV